MKKLILFFTLFLSLQLSANINLDDYDLSDEHRALIQRLIDRGIEDHLILKLIENIQRGNQRPIVYIPEHTALELQQVVIWAEGGAFNAFARYADVEFDLQSYLEDCPNMAIFNFGRATATAHLSTDVLRLFNGRVHQLELMRARQTPQEFRESYLRLIKNTIHSQYIRY